MSEDLLKIINHYGIIPQLKYFQSEIFELNEAIIRHDQEAYPSDIATEHITEEIADVLVMLSQFMEYYKIEPYDIHMTMEQKINRQLERIEGEEK